MSTDMEYVLINNNLINHNFAQAEALLLSLIEKDGDNPQFHAKLGELYESMGRLKPALKAFENAFGLSPGNSEYLYWMCEIALMRYDVEQTLSLCRIGQQQFPGDYHFQMVEADAWLWNISINDLEGEEKIASLEKCRTILDNLMGIVPDDGEITVIRGAYYLQMGDRENCLLCFTEAMECGLELYGDYVDLGLCLAILHIQKGEPKTAETHIRQALQKYDKWEEPHYLKMMLFREHLLLLLDVYFNERLEPEVYSRCFKEFRFLEEQGFFVHRVTGALRENFYNFLKARKEGDYENAIVSLERNMELFRGKLPLCIIFKIIKKPCLEAITRHYIGDMMNSMRKTV